MQIFVNNSTIKAICIGGRKETFVFPDKSVNYIYTVKIKWDQLLLTRLNRITFVHRVVLIRDIRKLWR